MAQKENELAAADGLFAGLPDGSTVVFTDGSSLGNPGPAGAGAVIFIKHGPLLEGMARRELWAALGLEGNNFSEVWAIGMACQVLLDTPLSPSDSPVSIFTDSKFAIGVLMKGWRALEFVPLVKGVIRLLFRLRALVEVDLHWVAGHVGFVGNELADGLANRGSELSRFYPRSALQDKLRRCRDADFVHNDSG